MMNPCDALYSKYISERKGLSSIWKLNGFVSFKILAGKECFIEEFFVEDVDRKKGVGRDLLHEVTQLATEANCEIITANIHLNDPGCHSTLQAAMACGFKVSACGAGVLLISMNIGAA